MAYDASIEHLNEGPSDEELWDEWLNGPACKIGAHPTVFHHQHVIGPATWHCSCGKVSNEAVTRAEIAGQKEH